MLQLKTEKKVNADGNQTSTCHLHLAVYSRNHSSVVESVKSSFDKADSPTCDKLVRA